MFSAVKWYVTVKTTLTSESDAGLQTTTAAFTSQVQTSCVPADIQMNVAARALDDKLLDDKLELFTNLGSNWTLFSIDDCIVHIACYHPYVGSSYIEIPEFLANKHCIINVQNYDDELCFKWAMLSALYKPTGKQYDVSAYDIHVNKLNFDHIRFPTSLSQIRQF